MNSEIPSPVERTQLLTFGWREWVGLPELGITKIKAKVDSGARTSALHAFEVKEINEAGIQRVQFKIHPLKDDQSTVAVCTADVIDERVVTDSGGHKETRWVISTPLSIGSHVWPIEITLTAREDMLFRMLLGRTAFKGRAMVDPARSYIVGKRPRKKIRKSNENGKK